MKNIFRLAFFLLLVSGSWTVIAQPVLPCPTCEQDDGNDPGGETGGGSTGGGGTGGGGTGGGGTGGGSGPDPCEHGPAGEDGEPSSYSASSGNCKGAVTLQFAGSPPDEVVWVWYRGSTRLTGSAYNNSMSESYKTHVDRPSGSFSHNYQLYREWEFCEDGPRAGFIPGGLDRYVSPVPSVSITKNESTSCIGDNVTLTADPSDFGTNPTYKWRQTGSSTVLHTGNTFSIPEDEYVTPGNKSFTVTVTGASTCSGIWKTATKSINIPGSLSSLEFLGGGIYCEQENDDVSLKVQDKFADPSFWNDYDLELYKQNGSSWTKLGTVGVNPDMGDPDDNPYPYFYRDLGKRGQGTYRLKIVKSGCSNNVWDENVITTDALPFQTVSVNSESKYIYKCEGENYVEIHTNHPNAMLYSLHSPITPVSGLDYGGSSIKGVLPACDFDCNYNVGLPPGQCISTVREKVSFRNVGPPERPTIIQPEPTYSVECEGSQKSVELRVDTDVRLAPPVDHPEDFPIEAVAYPVEYKWYENGVYLGSALNGSTINRTLGVGTHTYQVNAYSTLCTPNPEGGVKSFDSFSIGYEKEKPDAPVLENLTTCFTGTAELKASGFDSYTWYKNGSNNGISHTSSAWSFPLTAAKTGTYKVSAKYGDDPACVTDFSNAKTVALFTPEECDDYLNYVTVSTFDQTPELDTDGNPIPLSASKNYFDLAGEALQSQSTTYDADDQKQVMATQTIKDTYGRDVLQTLAAPLDRSDFLYSHKFVNTGGSGAEQRYESTHFDGSAAKKASPEPVAQTVRGTLGWYYGPNNDLEDNVPQTTYPYTRTDFYEDGSGEVKRSAAPGEALHMGTGKESITKTLRVGNHTVELIHYNEIRKTVLGLDAIPSLDRVYKQVSIDPDDKEVVSYQTEEGTIATAIVNSDAIHEVNFPTDLDENSEAMPLEIHIPRVIDEVTGDELNTEVTLTNPVSLSVHNKVMDEEPHAFTQVGNKISLPKGIYTLKGMEQASYNTHYTEYSYNIYDNAGRLAASIAPLGVQNILANGVPADRSGFTYTTFYTYDFQGRLIEMSEPDAGVTKYLYRKDGSIRFSENAEQRGSAYSYTRYDRSGRPVESGEYEATDYDLLYNNQAALEDTDAYTAPVTKNDWVETHYDLPYLQDKNEPASILAQELAAYMDTWHDQRYTEGHGYDTDGFAANYQQDFLEGTVSYTQNNEVTTWYSYDEFGQVTWIVMKYENMNGGQYFTIDYQYDYFGNVIEVAYQKHFIGEAFYHHYEYNKNQQLVKVYTSQSGVDDPYKYLHATYHYYLHGPLKRIELAENLQGLDYTYTVQGWLKAINNPNNNSDPGGDGNNTFCPDAFGMEIDYFDGDYEPTDVDIKPNDQFGGNIRSITWGREGSEDNVKQEVIETGLVDHLEETLDASLSADLIVETQNRIELIPGFDSNDYNFTAQINPTAQIEGEVITEVLPMAIEAQQYEYTYDFKNQLKDAVYTANADPEAFKVTGSNDNGIVYDANGNIQSLKRYDEDGAVADDLAYTYAYEEAGTEHPFRGNNNQLDKVKDGSEIYADYLYNDIGQMTAAIGRGEYGDQYFDYDVTGKVVGIYSDAAHTAENILASYQYDDRGFRIMKKVGSEETWYVRDASGNIISVYENKGAGLQLSELPIYGSGKIGTSFRDPQKHKYTYELTDHLGNVRTVVSKLKYYEVATMETENQFNESAKFENVANESLRDQNSPFNTTNINGNEVFSALLDGTTNVIGPAMSRAVKKGDKISFHVNAMYVDGTTGGGLVGSIASMIADTYDGSVGGENPNFNTNLEAAALAASNLIASSPNIPKAYIQCLVFDKDFENLEDENKHVMVSSAAAGYASTAENIGKRDEQALEITEDGYIYIYVANETQGAQVHFDDMTVSILGFDISEMTDYYPFGSVASHWEKEPYRYGYQGEYSEEDEETGFNHFEARSWDSKIARWNAMDPARQYASGYMGMGNNPISRVDPDGRLDDIYYNKNGSEAFRIENTNPDRYFNLVANSSFTTGFEAIEAFSRPDRTFGGFMASLWNSDFVRDITGDFLSFSYDTDVFVGYGGSIQQFSFTVPLRGRDAFGVFTTQSAGMGHGVDISMGGNLTKLRYEGPVNAPNFDAGLSRNTLVGSYDDVNFGVSVVGLELSVGEIAAHANQAGFQVHGRVVGIGGGPPSPYGIGFSYNSTNNGSTSLISR